MDFSDLSAKEVLFAAGGGLIGLVLAPLLIPVLQSVPGFPSLLAYLAWIVFPFIGAVVGFKYAEETE